MSFDVYISLAYALVCIASAFTILEIRKATIPSWSSLITSILSMFIWASAIKNSKLSPVHLSALFDVIGALAYFIGFAIFGEKISPIQWVGIVLMVFSIHLINK